MANTDCLMPEWLVPVQCRIIPSDTDYIESGVELGEKILKKFRVEVDDRNITSNEKLEDALMLKVPYIIRIGDNIELYDYDSKEFHIYNIESILSRETTDSHIFDQYSPMLLSQRIIN